jgi:hypothetical protein
MAARFAVAATVPTPIIYPDEYLYEALSQSLANGHFAFIRGGHVSFRSTTAYLAPALMAPMWLVAGVSVVYRLSQALGALAFATAVFPAYGLARRLGCSGRGSVAVAALAVAVPSGVFTSMLLSEAYAYPLFLLSVLVAVEALATPSLIRLAGTLVLGFGLCIAGGLQFLYFVPAFVAAFLLTRASSPVAWLGRGAIVVGGATYLVHAVESRGFVDLNYSASTLVSWFAVNLFAFAIGAGWVIVPGGLVGLGSLIARGDLRGRGFALLTAFLLGAMLLEATVWSASGQGVYERFTFYGAPLVAIAFVAAVEARPFIRGHVASVAYLAAVGAVLLPVLPPLHGAYDEHSPSIHALSALTPGGRSAALIWAPVLVAAALFVAWRGAASGSKLIVAALGLCFALSVGSSLAYIRHQPDTEIPFARAPSGSALVTWADADPDSLMKTLFWNPSISRVLVLGRARSPDPFPVTAVRLNSDGSLSAARGAVPGPFVFAPDTTVLGSKTTATRSSFTIVPRVPVGIAFGWYKTGYLAAVGRIFVRSHAHPRAVVLRLRTLNGAHNTIAFRCDSGRRRNVEVGPDGVRATVAVDAEQSCWFGIIRGRLQHVGRFNFAARGTIRLLRDLAGSPGRG